MKRNKFPIFKTIITLSFLFVSALQINAQVKVGLDNWYNHEIGSKTRAPFHYLWTDTALSGYSRWGKIFTDKGAGISTINRPNAAILSKISVYIIVDPDTTTENPSPNYIMPEDANAIEAWVKKGGVLMILANDAPNCEFTHLNQLTSRFGFTFNHVTLHPVTGKNYEMGACNNLPDHPIFKGVKKIYIKAVSSFKLFGAAKPIITENGQVLMAEARIGKGLVVAIGDPWIYNEYIDHDRLPQDFENRKAAENLSGYLLKNAKGK